jgi:hypothetical protein
MMADGSILAWGENNFGQLGLGSAEGPEECQADPCSQVPVRIPGISNAIAISAGEYHSMALLANGTVVGWGDDFNGQAGDGKEAEAPCYCDLRPAQGNADHESEDRAPQEAGDVQLLGARRDHRLRMHARGKGAPRRGRQIGQAAQTSLFGVPALRPYSIDSSRSRVATVAVAARMPSSSSALCSWPWT